MGKVFRNDYFIILLTITLCFATNAFNSVDLTAIALNGIYLLLILVFLKVRGVLKNLDNKRILLLPILGLLPILQFAPNSYISYLFIITGLILLIISGLLEKLKYLEWAGLVMIVISYFTLASIIDFYPESLKFTQDREQTIFFNVYIQDIISKSINDFRKESLLPLNISEIIYNKLFFAYYFSINVVKFLNPKNFYDSLLHANLYPLFLGIYLLFQKGVRDGRIFYLSWLFITVLFFGISRSTEKYTALFGTLPLLLYLVTTGLGKTNLKLYIGLLILSLSILLTPEI